MNPAGIHHVSINVSDVSDATEFYTKVLGLTCRTDRPDFGIDGAWLDLGSAQVHLIAGQVPAANGQHFAIGVADIDAAAEEIRAHGIKVRGPSPVGERRQAFLADPDGNSIELQAV